MNLNEFLATYIFKHTELKSVGIFNLRVFKT